jgi:hypothetical protein
MTKLLKKIFWKRIIMTIWVQNLKKQIPYRKQQILLITMKVLLIKKPFKTCIVEIGNQRTITQKKKIKKQTKIINQLSILQSSPLEFL